MSTQHSKATDISKSCNLSWQQKLAARITPHTLAWHCFDSLPSTQSWLQTTPADVDIFKVCLARQQTAGVGRRGTPWLSPLDHGLWCSVSCLIPTEPQPWSLMIGRDIATVLKSFGWPIQLKWPNDLLLNQQKCAGIIIDLNQQQNLQHITIGFGLNLYNHPELPATSIALNSVQPVDASTILQEILVAIHQRILHPETDWRDAWQNAVIPTEVHGILENLKH